MAGRGLSSERRGAEGWLGSGNLVGGWLGSGERAGGWLGSGEKAGE